MNSTEQAIFINAMIEAGDLIRSAQAAVAHAQSQCHAEVYEHVDFIAKRLYELRVRSEWLRHAVLAGWQLEEAKSLNQHGPDRRQGIDKRVENMKKQMTGDLGPDLAHHLNSQSIYSRVEKQTTGDPGPKQTTDDLGPDLARRLNAQSKL